jgi:MSHA biogenesis protein MshI
MKWNFLARANKQTVLFMQFYPDGLAISFRQDDQIQNHFLTTCPQNYIIALKTFVKQHHLKKAICHIVLGDQDYRLLLIDKPLVTQDELAQAVPWLVKDLIDFPLQEAAIDSFEIPTREEDTSHLYAVITKKKDLIDMEDLLHACQLQLASITILELAIQPLLQHPPSGDATTAYIYPREHSIYFLLSSAGTIHFVRKIGDMNELKETAQIDNLLLELQRSIDYCQTQLHRHLSDGIYFAPRLSALQEKADSISVPIQAINQQLTDEDSPFCLATIGALKIYETTH